MRLEQKKLLLDALLHMKNTTKPPLVGLCIFVDEYTKAKVEKQHLVPYFIRWPLYTGNTHFPIPSTGRGRKDPSVAYAKASCEGTLYSRRSKYGKLRHNLIDFMINELKQEIANEV